MAHAASILRQACRGPNPWIGACVLASWSWAAQPASPGAPSRDLVSTRRIGTSLALAGDCNGDGFEEVVAGAPGRDYATDETPITPASKEVLNGSVVLLDGKSFQPVWRAERKPGFGKRVLGIVDAAGPWGHVVAVGDPESNAALGSVRLLDAKTGEETGAIEAPRGCRGFGQQLAWVPQLDGSGRLAVAAFDEADPARSVPSVFLFARREGKTELACTLEEESARGRFGQAMAVSARGGIAGHASAVLLLGCPNKNASNAEDEAAGHVLVIDACTGAQVGSIRGAGVDQRFGTAVCVLPDIDGDTVEDIVVGAPGFDLPEADAGRISIFSGRTLALLECLQLHDPHPDRWLPAEEGSRFGNALCVVRADPDRFWLAVGAPGARGNGAIRNGWVSTIEWRRRDDGKRDLALAGLSLWAGDTEFECDDTGFALLAAGSPYDGEAAIVIGAPGGTLTHGGVYLYSALYDDDYDGKCYAR